MDRKKFKQNLKILHTDLFFAYQHFIVFVTLRKSLAPNVVSSRVANLNVDVMNKYSQFFDLTSDAHIKTALLELSKLYDSKDNRIFSLEKVINICNANGDNQFRKEYKELLEENKETLNYLKRYRSSKLVHFQIKIENTPIVLDKIERLFIHTNNFLDKVRHELYNETQPLSSRDIEYEINKLLKNLC